MVLTRSTGAERGAVVVAGWAIAGPDGALEAADRAMSGRARVDGVVVDAEAAVVARLSERVASDRGVGLVDGRALWGAAEATRAGVMAAVSAAHVAAGHADSILVVAARGASSVAVVLESGQPR